MSQSWTDDVYDPAHVGATDLQNIENNFAALKSSFSGTSAPSGAVAGQLFLDTTNKYLKIYSGSAWQEIWDYDNNQYIPSKIKEISGLTSCNLEYEHPALQQCTLNAGENGLGMLETGSIMLPPMFYDTKSYISVDGTTVTKSYFVYIPASATTIRSRFRGVNLTSVKFSVGGSDSNVVAVNGTVDTIYKDVSALSGWQTLTILAVGSTSGKLYAYSFYWSNS